MCPVRFLPLTNSAARPPAHECMNSLAFFFLKGGFVLGRKRIKNQYLHAKKGYLYGQLLAHLLCFITAA
ncbi:hypothetical protein ASF92_07245 [Pedobacter sp. Leaf176]|nr:hypothetical protein ASF92_07245 [Pedobacter sp. Leaf176]